jgi:hypothetical protein
MAQTPSPASPSPTTTLEEDLVVDLPGFAPAPPLRDPDPLDPETTTIESPLDALADWDDVEEEEEGPRPGSGPTAPRGGSSKASTDWRDLLPITSTLVGMMSLAVRFWRGRRRPLPDGVWVADEEDAEAIAAPLARIAARRSPLSGEGSADMVDGLEVLVGATGYTMKNLEREALSAGWTPDEATA